MKKLNRISQKTASAIVALMLGGLITFTAAMSTFGVTKNLEPNELSEAEILDMKMLERAYVDTFQMEKDLSIKSEVKTIKVYDSNDELLETIELGEGDIIENLNSKHLVHKAEYLSEYNNTSIYKISI